MVNVLPHYDDNGALVVADFYSTVAIELKKLMQKEYEKFEKAKENYVEKNGLFYLEEEEEQFEPSYYFDKISEFLQEVEVDALKYGQFFSTYIDENFEGLKKLDDINNALAKIERRVRKEVGEEELEEIRDSMVDELERLYKRAKRDFKKGKITLDKKGNAISLKKVEKLVPSSFYKKPCNDRVLWFRNKSKSQSYT